MDYNQKQSVNGREVSIIATYRDDEINKDYIIYTDETKTVEGKLNVMYGSYTLENGEIKVKKLETKEEEAKILEILKVVMKKTIEESNKQ